MKNLSKLFALASVSIALSGAAYAEKHERQSYSRPSLSARHAGQVDTDGILSRGEIPNNNIDYSRAQRSYEYRGDYRVDNEYNDRMADIDRRVRWDDYNRGYRYDRWHDRDDRYEDRYQYRNWRR